MNPMKLRLSHLGASHLSILEILSSPHEPDLTVFPFISIIRDITYNCQLQPPHTHFISLTHSRPFQPPLTFQSLDQSLAVFNQLFDELVGFVQL